MNAVPGSVKRVRNSFDCCCWVCGNDGGEVVEHAEVGGGAYAGHPDGNTTDVDSPKVVCDCKRGDQFPIRGEKKKKRKGTIE